MKPSPELSSGHAHMKPTFPLAEGAPLRWDWNLKKHHKAAKEGVINDNRREK